jgi:hypothetical protein
VSTQFIDVTDEVITVRRLRAAAVLPTFCAFCCLLFSIIFAAFDFKNRTLWSSLICSVPVSVLLARAIEHGAAWAVWVVTAIVTGVTLLAIVSIVQLGREIVSQLQGVAGSLLILIPCWLFVRAGLLAVFAKRKPTPWITGASRSAWRWLPRDGRFRIAFGTFTSSVLVYIAGAVAAGLLAMAFGGLALVGALAYIPVARFAGRIWTRGRRRLALRLQEIRKRDTRTPVLLLRSFDDDALPLESRFRLLWFFHGAKEACTLEECVVTCLWQLGPVIAVGNPRDELSPLGAAREYISADQWRAVVQQYLEETSYVVCILGSTPGLNWEYEQLQTRGDHNVLVVVPHRSLLEIQRRWQVFQSIFHRAAAVDVLSDLPAASAWPLLILFPVAGAPIVFACRYRNETAYAVAINRFLEILEQLASTSRRAAG